MACAGSGCVSVQSTPEPVNDSFFVYYNPVGLLKASTFGSLSHVPWGTRPLGAFTKVGVPDMCANTSREILSNWSKLKGVHVLPCCPEWVKVRP